MQSTPESGARAEYDGHKRKKGSKVPAAVDTTQRVPGHHLLALTVTPANVDDRKQVESLQVPPPLMQRLYAAFTYPGETILDCFNGAGTSTLVAAQMGRGYIGIELSPDYHALASERHRQWEMGEDPFAKRAPDHTPPAKNSRVGRLRKQRYDVSKKVLQFEVRRIAQELGRLPSREEVAARTTGMTELPKDTVEAQMRLALERPGDYAAGSRGHSSKGP